MGAGEIVVLSGPPGAGKTTVAGLLAAGREHPAVHLLSDAYYRSIRSGYVAPFLADADRQNRVVIGAVVASAVAFARGGYDVVVDGVVGPWFLAPFVDAARAEGLALSYVVLRPDRATAVARAGGRAGEDLRDATVVADLHGQFADLGVLERHALDSGGEPPERTAERVAAAVASGAMRVVDP